ncbi:hypothetical protein MCP_2882 [Methanocella paludicola SANAE]|uniref:Glycosyltransferase RgtA/B/C/D-like domain-containing protein n=1 Tax=Methanocella paludicola (strain DSM 17711 / JCM 13418 / NBRC 101707 / SANAE) TaxID=304371 RepID=D1Z2N2_METPS|nr:hypothetical protein [Methanocella paludicola]BAI62954.1 hypothetical protein MCP_2882 [Methanocella paludicola SANAE]
MEQQLDIKNVRLDWRTAFAAALIIFILFGLGTKLVMSLNMGLNSDMVGEGIEAMEIWKHQNYFLSGYYLPSQDTFLFTELIPFQLIPQILTNYDPTALKLMTFVEFVLGVGVLGYVIYMVTGEALHSLLFGALMANVPAEGYQYFALPTSHTGTVIFLGLILALLIYVDKKVEGEAQKTKKGKKVRSTKILWAPLIALTVLTALTVLSDTIVLPWLIVPFILVYLLFVKNKSNTMNVAVAAMAAVSVIVYIFKTYFIYNWVVQDVLSSSAAADVPSTVGLYFTALAALLNQGLYGIAQGFKDFGILEVASLLAFLALAALALKGALEDKKNRLFYGVLLASAATMFAMWMVSDYTIDIASTRYLTFTAITVFMLIAMCFRPDYRIYGALALALLLISAVFGALQMGDLQQPNAAEYGLISYLKENNQTFGYGGYWSANIVTYLSGEDVIVRKAVFYRNDIKPWMWHSCERWYQSTPDNSFILVDNSTISDTGREVVGALAASLNASEAMHYDKFVIYPIQGFHIAPFQVQRS